MALRRGRSLAESLAALRKDKELAEPPSAAAGSLEAPTTVRLWPYWMIKESFAENSFSRAVSSREANFTFSHLLGKLEGMIVR